MNTDDGLMQFVDEDNGAPIEQRKKVWRILIIDDESDVHSATTFAMRNTEVVGRNLEFLHATSAREAKEVLKTQDDIAVVLLDVVMETPNAGLDLVPVIRDELDIKDTRIILRTGQPNQAPEIEVIRDYDINDYKLKSELTQARLFASLTTAIRSYKQIQTIEAGKESLTMMVKSSAEFLTPKGVRDFAQGVITHLSGLLSVAPEGLICVKRNQEGSSSTPRIIAAAGHFLPLVDQPLDELEEVHVRETLQDCLNVGENIINQHGLALYIGGKRGEDMACFISNDAEFDDIDEDLLELFCENITICADNLELVNRLSEYAYNDDITGLPNRHELHRALENRRKDKSLNGLALGVIDLDSYTEIDATFGQNFGDELLAQVGARLQDAFAPDCVVARVGDDCFAVLGPIELLRSNNALQQPFNDAFVAAGHPQMLFATCSLVPIDEEDANADVLLKRAFSVLKIAKQSRRGQVCEYQLQIERDAKARLALLGDLHRDFEAAKLELVYEPCCRLDDRRLESIETVLLWKTSTGEVSPEAFIPLAETSGLILPIGEWVLTSAIKELANLTSKLDRHISLSINLSPIQLQNPRIFDALRSSLSKYQVDPERLTLEFSCNALRSRADASRESLNKIRDLGCKIALDDFGVGDCSLNLIRVLSADQIKLDRSFTHAAASQDRHSTEYQDIHKTLQVLIKMGEILGVEIIAKDVESEVQARALFELGCSQGQGYWLAKPMVPEELLNWLE